MGYLVGTSCFIDLPSAHDAWFSTLPPSSFSQGSYLYESIYLPDSVVGRSSPSGWSRQTTEYPLSGGSSTSVTFYDLPSPAFPSCDPAQNFIDGLTVGWGVASALVAVAAIKMMQRART